MKTRTIRCPHCFRPQPVTTVGALYKHPRGLETCSGSGQKVTR